MHLDEELLRRTAQKTILTYGIVPFVSIVLIVFFTICIWRLYTKMGEPGWTSLIPFYCNWVLCKHTWGNGAMMFTWFIPAIGSIFMLITCWKWLKGFGKPAWFRILGLLCFPIALAICAFDSSEYSDQLAI